MMHRRLSFKTLLLLSFWGVLILAMLLPAWYYERTMSREILAEEKGGALRDLNLLHWLMTESVSFENSSDLQTWLLETGKRLGVRITYVAEGGRIVADTQIPFQELGNLENFASRPEIVDAGTQEVGSIIRYSSIMEKQQVFAARKIPGRGGIPAGFLRVGATPSGLQDLLERMTNVILFTAALAFAAVVFLTRALIRHSRSPIGQMIEAVRASASGDYSRRIHVSPDDEFYLLAQALNEAAEDSGSRLQTIVDQKQQLEAVFNGMQEGVMVLDSRGKIRSINRALFELLPAASRSLGRRPLEVIMSLELQEACDKMLSSHAEAADESAHLEIGLGKDLTYDVNTVLLPDRKRDMGAIVVFHDISELKRLERVRQDFVANVSHELRTPLTSIKGYTETLLAEAEEKPQMVVPFLRVVLKNADHMVKMADDLLQLAKLEAPARPMEPVPVDAAEALTAAWRACAPLADEKGIRLVSLLPETGLNVMGDFDQLVQVFRNLLENGIKYSPQGSPLTVASHADGKSVILSVRDEGVGIPRQYQHRIFERFYRIERNRSTYPGSTGLGLAICRHIVLNHKGTIWVQSPNPGKAEGTTFFFTIPHTAEDEGGSVA